VPVLRYEEPLPVMQATDQHDLYRRLVVEVAQVFHR